MFNKQQLKKAFFLLVSILSVKTGFCAEAQEFVCNPGVQPRRSIIKSKKPEGTERRQGLKVTLCTETRVIDPAPVPLTAGTALADKDFIIEDELLRLEAAKSVEWEIENGTLFLEGKEVAINKAFQELQKERVKHFGKISQNLAQGLSLFSEKEMREVDAQALLFYYEKSRLIAELLKYLSFYFVASQYPKLRPAQIVCKDSFKKEAAEIRAVLIFASSLVESEGLWWRSHPVERVGWDGELSVECPEQVGWDGELSAECPERVGCPEQEEFLIKYKEFLRSLPNTDIIEEFLYKEVVDKYSKDLMDALAERGHWRADGQAPWWRAKLELEAALALPSCRR